MADLTGLLEDEAARKADGERRSRRDLLSACADDRGCGGGGSDGPIPSSELRRFGKKLEEAVRSREYAADVAQRLATDKKLPRKRVSGISGSLRSTGGAVVGGKEDCRSKGRASLVDAGTNERGHRSGRNRPSLKPAPGVVPGRAGSPELESPSHRDPIRASKTLTTRRASSGSGPAEGEWEDPAAAVARQSGGRGRERGVLTSKLRGAVRLSREEEALDDERFLN